MGLWIYLRLFQAASDTKFLHQPLGLAKNIAIYPRLRRDLVVVATSNKVRKFLDLWLMERCSTYCVGGVRWYIDSCFMYNIYSGTLFTMIKYTDYTFEYAWHSDLCWISLVCVFASGLELFCVLTTTCFDLQNLEVDQKTPFAIVCCILWFAETKTSIFRNEQDLYVCRYLFFPSSNSELRDSMLLWFVLKYCNTVSVIRLNVTKVRCEQWPLLDLLWIREHTFSPEKKHLYLTFDASITTERKSFPSVWVKVFQHFNPTTNSFGTFSWTAVIH